ncbi:MAG: IS30 family transposase [Betaproteobacteria bacterium]|nr:IS30 family transposase [Betaproteobacteria bacterium]
MVMGTPLWDSVLHGLSQGLSPEQVSGLLSKRMDTRTRGDDRRGLIPNMTSIDERPLEVSQRLVPGHWEGDLIKGAYNRSQIGTLVERTTLFTVLARVDSATAFGTANAFSTVLNKVDAQMRLSMTYDQGREMAAHSLLTQNTGVQVYFAHPHSPWERGINENTNGLLRQYFPKGSDLSVAYWKSILNSSQPSVALPP